MIVSNLIFTNRKIFGTKNCLCIYEIWCWL